ncbi:MAG: GNAT family N-acetyltransferase [Reyranella sp.]|uniref:GNAT family N-acetyltransferase n=1 Tax=Reyranella sp. TaxID=1929291 RepID=UPI00121041A9|nr:GNAT family N-acetyltransferase [Reyranella sp.]TAJ87845.1 MAG: GNAT family N-acetyltransferase [Reyranella sp.]TBR22528.1 MAG: GNAT family N-acetyltransferase [Reyranella sp.]
MNAGFVLNPLRAVDLDRASRLHREAFLAMGEPGWTRQDIAGLLASPGVAAFLLTESNVDVGMAICRTAADEAELLAIAVDPAHRRRGAARLLLGAVIDRVRGDGARTLFLEVGADNPGALKLYNSLGFETVGRRTAYYMRGDGPAADAFVMRLDFT